jgi:hypothetical protein
MIRDTKILLEALKLKPGLKMWKIQLNHADDVFRSKYKGKTSYIKSNAREHPTYLFLPGQKYERSQREEIK